jgi:WD40 repeat protein
VFFDRSGRRIITPGEGEMRVWDLAATSPTAPPLWHSTAVRGLAFSPDGKTLLAIASVPRGHDDFVRVWSTETFEPVTPPLHAAGVISATFDPRGARIATGGSDGHARIWDARSGEPLGPPLVQNSLVAAVSFSPDGRFLATGGGDRYYEEVTSGRGDIHVWDAATGESKWSQQISGAVSALAYSPDGARLEIATRQGDVSFWNANTGVRLPGELHHGPPVLQIVVSTDGRWSASVSARGVHLWDHARGAGQWLGSNASNASFDSRNARLAIGTFDGQVGVWEAATGQALGWRMKPGGMIYRVRFDRDDRYLATASLEGSMRVWDRSGRAVSPRLRHEGPVWSTEFSPDNRTIASGGGGTVRISPFAQQQGSPEELGRLVEVLSGYRFDASMVPVPLSREDLKRSFDELKKNQPSWFAVTPQKEAQWERAAADWSWRTGRAYDVARHLDRVVELEPLRATAWAERASARAELGQWDGAIADFEQAIRLRPDEARHVRDLALARLGAKDETGYRRTCAALRNRFGATANPDRGQWIARTCALLAPAAGEDVSWLVRAAERSTEMEPGGSRHRETLGAAMMRAGRPEAAATLRRALEAAPQERGALAFLMLAILEAKPRPKPCDRSIVEGRLAGAGPPVTWREGVEVEALVRELCTAATK